MDHMAFLGNTLTEIAEKKVGIIKPFCRVVTTRQSDEVALVIKETIMSRQVPFVIADVSEARTVKESFMGQQFTFEGETYEIALAGVHQKENAVLALKALEILNRTGFATTIEQRKKGLADTCWSGRFTVIHKNPVFVVDGAHNPGAARMLAASIRRYFNGKKIYYIMGMFRDKDYTEVLRLTAPYAQKILTIQTPDNPRALDAEDLAEAARAFHPDTEACPDMDSAVEKAFHLAGADDVIIAFGSLSFIGELTRIVKEREDGEND
jgi:dihydrofolate synthase/folylpolyglutamate synthase